MAASTKDSMMAGPAWFAAAWPVMTKMPPPMTAPMPSAVRPQGPSVRCRLRPSASAWLAWGCLVAQSCRNIEIPEAGARAARRNVVPERSEAGGSAAGLAVHHGSARCVAHLAVAVAVEEVDQQADHGPAG